MTLVTPAADVSHWTHNTLEQERIQTRLIELGVAIRPLHAVSAVGRETLSIECVYTGRKQYIPCSTFVPVTMRRPVDGLYQEVVALVEAGGDLAPKSVTRIGDCYAPGTIAAAVYSGHRFARELGELASNDVPFRREMPAVAHD